MKKFTFFQQFTGLCTLCLLSAFPASAQTAEHTCGTDEVRKNIMQLDPDAAVREAELEEFTQSYVEEHAAEGSSRSAAYIIPVVFHIIHDYGTENISDEQIYNAIDNMNADFSKTNSDFAETITEYLGIAADSEIEFRLARKNLGGGCVSGIERIPSYLTYAGSDYAKLNPWQKAYYLNIWVVKTLPEGVAAYAYYPSSSDGFMAPYDGVIARHDYVGDIGTSSLSGKHTLSHEVGHYLNLQHTWGNTNEPGVECGDDNVSDTPITKGWTTCNLSAKVCDTAIIENVQNFMEYSFCETMFTEKQKLRMHAALNSSVGQRSNLWQEATLELTGTNDGYVAPTCTPVADFYSDDRYLCDGNSTTFHDVSWNADVTSRTWSFEGGSPATSTDTDPTVSFSGTGWHKITLTVNNGAGSNTKEISEYLYVSSSTPALTDSYYGDFDDAAEVAQNWSFINKYQDTRAWSWRPNNGYGVSSGCAWLNSYHGANGDKDEFISPSFNLEGSSASNLYFKYSTNSYAPLPSEITASLKLYYSTNCGDTWFPFGTAITGTDLDIAYSTGELFPNDEPQWAIASFNLSSAQKQENVKFKIEFTYDYYVNNVFIDDFNFFDSYLTVEEQNNIASFTVAPNPASSSSVLQLHFNLQTASDVELTAYDITGNIVAQIENFSAAAGSHTVDFDAAAYHLTPGCYLIKLSNSTGFSTQKVILD